MADNNAHTVVQLILLFNEQKSHPVLLSIQIEYDLKKNGSVNMNWIPE